MRVASIQNLSQRARLPEAQPPRFHINAQSFDPHPAQQSRLGRRGFKRSRFRHGGATVRHDYQKWPRAFAFARLPFND
jgi:hypothetical protein